MKSDWNSKMAEDQCTYWTREYWPNGEYSFDFLLKSREWVFLCGVLKKIDCHNFALFVVDVPESPLDNYYFDKWIDIPWRTPKYHLPFVSFSFNICILVLMLRQWQCTCWRNARTTDSCVLDASECLRTFLVAHRYALLV